MGFYTVPETIKDDMEKLKENIELFKTGELASPKFKAFRVPMGIYEQRENNIYMMRVRVPGGGIEASQINAIVNICREFNLVLHLTTRQDIQMHNVKIDDLYSVYKKLYENGLTCKGGGGNTVRNIMACSESGICRDEVYDVLPYCIGATNYLREPVLKCLILFRLTGPVL